MISDITPPANVKPLIRVRHISGPYCKSWVNHDNRPRKTHQAEAMLDREYARLDTLAAHCKHPQTRTILMRRTVETAHGTALEHPEDAQQCLGCGAVLWGNAL